MVQEYEILWGTEKVGEALITREGLYYRFQCRCRLDPGVYRLIAVSADREWDLGVLLPELDSFRINTKVPAKCFLSEEFSFYLETKRSRFIAVREGEPVPFLCQLRNAAYAYRNGQPGILLSTQSAISSSSPTGQ